MAEPKELRIGVAALQNFAESGAVLAVLPRQALDRFKGCLPEGAN